MNNIQKNCLVESARWQKLMGVVMMVCTALVALLGVFFIVIMFIDGEDAFGGDVLGTVTGVALGVMYLLFSVLYYFFGIYLLRSAKALNAWEKSGDEADLTEGLRNTKSFFRLSGIFTIIAICALGFAIVGAVVFAIIAVA